MSDPTTVGSLFRGINGWESQLRTRVKMLEALVDAGREIGRADIQFLLNYIARVQWEVDNAPIPRPGSYGEPTIPLFTCGKHCNVELTSKGRDDFIDAQRVAFAEAYRVAHGEFPSTDLQIDAILEAEEIFDRRVAMRKSVE